eukprot:g2381.t1
MSKEEAGFITLPKDASETSFLDMAATSMGGISEEGISPAEETTDPDCSKGMSAENDIGKLDADTDGAKEERTKKKGKKKSKAKKTIKMDDADLRERVRKSMARKKKGRSKASTASRNRIKSKEKRKLMSHIKASR